MPDPAGTTATPPTPTLDRLVDDGTLPGWSVAVRAADGTVHVRTRGVTAPDGGRPVEASTSYRLASLSKPVAGLLAGILTTEGVLAPDDEIRRWVPELDGLRVLRRPDGPLDDTEALARPVTVRDLLTMTSGLGTRFVETPLTTAMADAGVHPGPVGPAMDDATFLARLGSLPLAFQPGSGWAYHTSTDVLSVVLARASGVPLDRLLADRLTGPLDTPSLTFATPDEGNRADAWLVEGGTWARLEPEGPADPQMLTLSCGLWGTAEDTARVLGELVDPTVVPDDAATRVRTAGLGPDQLAAARPIVPDGYSYGHQVSVATDDDPQGPRAGSAGWSGGTGTLGVADPAAGRTVVLLTNRGLDGSFGTGAFDAALADLWADVRGDGRPEH
ncbi:serine hydrolase domain-containing protein [Oryzobacter terrae]|uniref:serine hydrolase domain-containing protein n=1 Tax=Oryzobacter terrae TaxID=1620385 RepID=UPI00366BA553